MADPAPPFWFLQRQGKTEASGPDIFKLTAPNLPPVFIGIRPNADGAFAAFLRTDAAGDDKAVTEAASAADAWGAAFELYRNHIVT
jgi:hypothetical protein